MKRFWSRSQFFYKKTTEFIILYKKG